jgi:hypothetical protein
MGTLEYRIMQILNHTNFLLNFEFNKINLIKFHDKKIVEKMFLFD